MKQIILLAIIPAVFVQCLLADTTCHSIDIKHETDLEKLKDCLVVTGHVRLSNFRITEISNIASSLEEITDYLLVYRVDGLPSLEHIFPNLTIIRGQNLLFEKYALVIYENRNLRDLGLKSLLKIRVGSIQVESNPVLCFTNTVNWVYLMDNHSLQQFSLKGNKDLNECPMCPKNIENPETMFFKTNCWNLKHFQRRKPIPHLGRCPDGCGMSGCTKNGICCSSLCLTGCSARDCRICKNYQSLDGYCVEYCNIPYYTLAEQCITESECRKKGLIPHAGSCINKCPRNYQHAIVNGLSQCNLLCNQNFTIRLRDDLEDVKDCVVIRGSLHIELKDDKSDIIGALEKALGAVKEISGYLKITKSPQLVSLGFFKKLDTIKGENLIDGEISFYVVDNFHLEEIWPDNHKVALLKGRVFFHLNPRLCYEKILQLAPSIRSHGTIGVKDASRNSNGERVICGSRVRPLHPVVEDVNATAARIRVDPLPSSDKEVVLGYLHYYKEAPVKNVTMFDGRHGCGRDNWRMDMTLDRNIRHVVKNLRPFTQYAFFVKTLTMVDYHMKMDWCSSINYFRTSPMKPGPVQKIYSTSIMSTTIIIHWWPPKETNGIIEKYILRVEPINLHINHSQVVGYSSRDQNSDCECGIPPITRLPPPNDLAYYNREQVIIDEAIPNFIFVSTDTIRRLEEERRREDNTRRKRETAKSTKDAHNSLDTTVGNAKKNISAEEQEKIDSEKATELLFKKHLEEMERKSILQQDTGVKDFLVESPKPICVLTNPSEGYQKEHDCSALEHYDGIEVSSKIHSYILENLESDKVYRVSIRACVEGLQNGCGIENSIAVETVSKSMEYFLNGP